MKVLGAGERLGTILISFSRMVISYNWLFAVFEGYHSGVQRPSDQLKARSEELPLG